MTSTSGLVLLSRQIEHSNRALDRDLSLVSMTCPFCGPLLSSKWPIAKGRASARERRGRHQVLSKLEIRALGSRRPLRLH
jgi:hypothetical protein